MKDGRSLAARPNGATATRAAGKPAEGPAGVPGRSPTFRADGRASVSDVPCLRLATVLEVLEGGTGLVYRDETEALFRSLEDVVRRDINDGIEPAGGRVGRFREVVK